MSYVCTNCGLAYAKWQGKCDTCQVWNTVTQVVAPAKGLSMRHKIATNPQPKNRPKTVEAIEAGFTKRIATTDEEFNRILGGGIVPGSLILLGGEPGIGKSTLLLQVALQLKGATVLYASGEETEHQIKMRATRLSCPSAHCFVLQENALTEILKHTNDLQPALLVIDSIQTLYCEEEEGAIGSMHQIRACAMRLLQHAKTTGVAIFLIGHINKEGALAGPKLLEHMVDTVLQFEGDKSFLYRMVRAIKNRFGATSELGIYEMKKSGLHAVANPSELLLSTQNHGLSGIAIGTCLEGTRPLMLEIQALATTTRYGNPQRNATGFEPKRLTMLLAVLEKRAGLRLYDQDVFLNVTGGFKAEDTALDLAVCMAVASSLRERSLSKLSCFIAEIGLGGELRSVARIERRIEEAQKLGFKEVYIAMQSQPFSKPLDVSIYQVKNIKDLITRLLC